MAKRVFNETQNITLLDAVNRMLEDSQRPEKAVAADIGKALSTLQRELNPHDEGAKLGAEMLYPLIVAAHGKNSEEPPLPLQWLASRLGFRCVPVSRHRSKEEPSPDAVRAMRVIVDFIALCEDECATVEEITSVYDTAVYEIEKFATRATRERGGHIALASLRKPPQTSWWERLVSRWRKNEMP